MTNLAHKIDSIVNAVHVTCDYSKFTRMKGNRSLNRTNLNNLLKSLSKLQIPVPIIVDELFRIADGQHRFEACKELNLPIYYIVIPSISIYETKLLNTVSTKWSSETFLSSYCDEGIKEYLIIRDFMTKNKISLDHALPFFTMGTIHGHDRQAFREGVFEIKDLEKTEKFYEQYQDFKNCPAFDKQLFKIAVIQFFKQDKYCHNRMQDKLSYQSYKLSVRSYLSEYTNLLLEVYNFKSRNDAKLVDRR